MRFFSASPHPVRIHGINSDVYIEAAPLPPALAQIFDAKEICTTVYNPKHYSGVKQSAYLSGGLKEPFILCEGSVPLSMPKYTMPTTVDYQLKKQLLKFTTSKQDDDTWEEEVKYISVVIFVSMVTASAMKNILGTPDEEYIDPQKVSEYLGIPNVAILIPYSGREPGMVVRKDGAMYSTGGYHWVTKPWGI